MNVECKAMKDGSKQPTAVSFTSARLPAGLRV